MLFNAFGVRGFSPTAGATHRRATKRARYGIAKFREQEQFFATLRIAARWPSPALRAPSPRGRQWGRFRGTQLAPFPDAAGTGSSWRCSRFHNVFSKGGDAM